MIKKNSAIYNSVSIRIQYFVKRLRPVDLFVKMFQNILIT